VSNLEQSASVDVCGGRAEVATEPVFDRLPPRPVFLTPRQWTDASGALVEDPLTVQRFLPTKGRRIVGAWCFVDLYGPADISAAEGMQVPPHPHCGLQTVSWLLAGEVLHRDSVGSTQLVRPGQLNLMTAGRGIAHAENSKSAHAPILHGAQLWVALPDADRDRAPAFEHHADLPSWRDGGATATVMLGSLDGVHSPATVFTPIMGADIALSGAARVPLRPDWEYAALSMTGDATVDGQSLEEGEMVYLGCGREQLSLASAEGRLLLIGGEPFDQEIVMWWNFIGRSHDDIVEARADWMTGDRFGVVDYDGDPLPAPPIPPVRLKPRGRE
jgi:redox-sensitive bicupin YhaK (pirin superfamily)